MYKLLISDRAQSDIRNVFAYLIENWPESVRIKFEQELFKTVQILKKDPEIFPLTDLKDIRKAVITKHNSILYSFHTSKGEIRIVRIFDTRLHPKKR